MKFLKRPIFYFPLFLILLFGQELFSQLDQTGEWSDPIGFGMVPVAVANLPDGNLIAWSSKFRDGFDETGDGMTWTQLFNPNIGLNGGTVAPAFQANTDHDMFCPGINNLADGRILSAGGTSSERTSIYDPQTGLWSVAEDMNIPRGYQGNVTLQDGSVFTLGGSWSDGAFNNGGKDAELWSPLTGWMLLPNIQGSDIFTEGYAGSDLDLEGQGLYRVDNHLWLWPAPNGKLFHAGPSEMMHWIDPEVSGGEIIEAGIRQDLVAGEIDTYSMKGTTVMFDTGKILKVGGAESYGADYLGLTPAKNNAFVIDLNGVAYGQTPQVTFANNLNFSRTMHNSTVLPNGEVLVTGGLDRAAVFSDTGARFGSEIYNPNTNSWRTVADFTIPRTYHSVAILLPTGKVFVGGGGLCDASPGCEDHMNAEIYSPPYLFNGDALATRPVITNVDSGNVDGTYNESVVDYNSTINVTTDSNVSEFSLIRFSAATHSTNNEQRRISLTTALGTNHTLNIPDRNLLPPGFYMLFALNPDGVPSEAATLKIGNAIPLQTNPDLVLNLKFDESTGATAFDSSEYNHDAPITERDDNGNIVTADNQIWDTDGLFGNALRLDGTEFTSNTIIETDYTPVLATIENEITVSAWVWRDADGSAPDGNGGTKVPNMGVFSHDYPAIFAGFHNTLLKWSFETSDGFMDCYSGYAPLDAWVHITVTYDGQTARLYSNGVEVCSRPITGQIQLLNDASRYSRFTTSGFYDHRYDIDNPPVENPTDPNGNLSGVTDELDGKMDELQVYNKALGPNEVLSLFQQGQAQGNPDVAVCPNGTIVAEYKIGVDGNWVEGTNINAPEGSVVFIRAKDYSGQYFVTTTQFDGPTFNSSTDLNAEGAYQIDTGVSILPALPPWDNPNRGDGLVDSSNEGQFVLTTPEGCPEVITLNVIGSCDTGDTPVEQQYNINGTWCSDNGGTCGEPRLFLPTGTDIIVSGLPDNVISVTITLPDGSQRPDNYTFTLDESNQGVYVITSNEGCSSTLEILVDDSGNIVPIADAGPDQTVPDADLSGSENVTLDGTASTDSDGTIVSYSWKENGIEIATGANPIVDFNVGIHNLVLTVTDNNGASDTDNVTITVSTPDNNPPFADAGPDQTVLDIDSSGSESVTLDGSDSNDSDGTIVSYSWSENGTEIATGINPVVDLTVGVHNIILTVTDDDGAVDTDTVIITVTAPNINPVADAGADQTVLDADASGSENVTLDGSASSDSDGTIVSYSWSENGTQIAIGVNPIVDLTVGVHNITLTVTDNNAAIDTDTVIITVTAPNINPVADAGADQTVLDADASGSENVTLDGSASSDSDGTIVSYLWSENGTEIATGINPVVDLTVGVHNIILTVTDDDGAVDTDTVIITVNVPNNNAPLADVGADQTVLDADASGSENVTLDGSASSDSDGTIVSYSWSENGVEIATGINPVVDLTVGVHDIILTVTDDDGAVDTDTVTITVNAPNNNAPVADAGADQTVLDADASGSENVTLDGSASSDSDGTIVSYSWSENGVEIATGINPIVDLTVGVHDIILTVTDDDGAVDTDTVTITVNAPNNNAPVANAGADQTVLDADASGSENVTLDGSASSDSDGTIVSYSWSENGVEIATGINPIVDLTVGVHDIILTVTDDDGAVDTDTVTITVNAPNNNAPVANAGADQTVLDADASGSENVTLDGSASNDSDGTIVSYSWSENGTEIATGINPVVDLTVGVYDITLTVTDDDGATSSDEVTIMVNQVGNGIPPTAIISATPDNGEIPLIVEFSAEQSTDDDGTIESYSWDFGDGTFSNESVATHTYENDGTYEVLLTVLDNEGLKDSTSTTIVAIINEAQSEFFTAIVAPNPASSVAQVHIEKNGIDVIGVQLFDINGKLVNTFMPQNIETSDGFAIPIGILSNQTYILKLYLTNGESIDLKLLIQN